MQGGLRATSVATRSRRSRPTREATNCRGSRRPARDCLPRWSLIAIAGASPDHAPAITRDLVERALDLPSDEDEALFAPVPLAASMTEPHARRLCQRLLNDLDWKRRPDLLDDCTKDDLGHLAPLFARVAGPQGIAEVAREIADVARACPEASST
ncbi:hypothetical protein BE18_30545 [Sorangium cellulosum]|uniref:Uncharacterized protein n=1 Tax=Sorangium cellulosum TaxID=56 RepID=A0A150SM42_SORCE|nr:hypothetical protein BE18_30545 [Sorangium cellulosum]